jgi:hypothetical protein
VVVVQRYRPEPARRLAGRRQQSVAGGTFAAAGGGQSAGLASGPCALVAASGLAGGDGDCWLALLAGDSLAAVSC